MKKLVHELMVDNARRCFLQARIPQNCKENSPGPGWGILLVPHEQVFHPVALSVEDQQVAVVDETIDHRRRHRLVTKDFIIPLSSTVLLVERSRGVLRCPKQ